LTLLLTSSLRDRRPPHYALAQSNLAVCYDNGLGVPKSYKDAVLWYRKATEQGHAIAQTNLAVCYENGEGVPRDRGRAIELYRLSAKQGYTIAIDNLKRLGESI
jgi:uncharacterized protein